MAIGSRHPGVGARAIEGPVCNPGAHLGSISFIPKDDAYRLIFVVSSDPIYVPNLKGRKNLGYGRRLIFSDSANCTLIPRSLRIRTPRPASCRFRVRNVQRELMLGGLEQQWFGLTRLLPIWTFVTGCKIAVQPVNLHN